MTDSICSQDIINEHDRQELADHHFRLKALEERLESLEKQMTMVVDILKRQDHDTRIITANLPNVWKVWNNIAGLQGELTYTRDKVNEHLFRNSEPAKKEPTKKESTGIEL